MPSVLFAVRGRLGLIHTCLSLSHRNGVFSNFDSYDKRWLDFVAKCRAGNDESEYDIVIGGVVNDRVIQTLDRYFEGEISEDEALGLLVFEKPNIQYCIRSQRMLDECLKHIESIQL